MSRDADASSRTVTANERPEVPWLSIVLGYGPMLPFVAGAGAIWFVQGF